MPQIFDAKSRMLARAMGALEAPGKDNSISDAIPYARSTKPKCGALRVADVGSEALGPVEGAA